MSLKRWLQIAFLGVFALLGLFGAAGALTPPGQYLGVGLAVASFVAAMIVIKQHFDGAPDSRAFLIMPSQPRNILKLLVILGLMALAGLYLAASGDPYLHWTGLALTVASTLLGFRTIGAYFDAVEHTRTHGP